MSVSIKPYLHNPASMPNYYLNHGRLVSPIAGAQGSGVIAPFLARAAPEMAVHGCCLQASETGHTSRKVAFAATVSAPTES